NFLVCGDLNSRTGKLNIATSADFDDPVSEMFVESRFSQDMIVNEYGRALLSLCAAFNLQILNGCTSGDCVGKYTYISRQGSSVIDYFITSDEMIPFCTQLRVSESVMSSHMPVELYMNVTHVSGYVGSERIERHERIVWDESCAGQYVRNLQLSLNDPQLQVQICKPDLEVDVDAAVEIFTHCLVQAADFLKKTFVRSHVPRSKEWFDKECAVMKKELQRRLRKFLRTLCVADRMEYAKFRNNYKQLIRDKRQMYRNNMTTALISNVKDSKVFWKHVKKMTRRYYTLNHISPEVWARHFKGVFSELCNCGMYDYANLRVMHVDCPSPDLESLDSAITYSEILEALKDLKLSKAPGLDGVLGEMLKCSAAYIVDYLLKMFNVILNCGRYPRCWCKSVILPLHKKGSYAEPDNYRGISLTSILSKVFMHIVQSRLQKFVEKRGIIVEEQSGFRKGYSTVDNVFVLHGIIDKYLSRRKKLYIAFIDFRKAFDSVNRKALWKLLDVCGIRGKLVAVLKSMYDCVSCCVRCSEGLSEYFECPNGVKQGCKCSPLLFSIVINAVALEIKDKGKHGVQLIPNSPEIVALLFADDVALVSDTVIGLQNQLDNLTTAADRLGLIVNTQKSKVMIFRKGGHRAAHEKWSVGGVQLEVVKQYKYLGKVFSTKLSVSVSLADLVCRAKAALSQICRSLRKLAYITPEAFFKIFDAQVQPILLYAAEVWGLEDCSAVEIVHLYALKQFLNVSVRTPNMMVYGDTGRYPLSICATLRTIKY
ncbi:MAG: hypothetical protein DSZ28_02740, partial [Thiothrix sp.]